MREIKFRSWYPRVKKIRPVLELDFDCNRVRIFGHGWKYILKSNIELMQYTGLKDSQGNEIYEGDIIATIKDENNLTTRYNPKYTKKQRDNAFKKINESNLSVDEQNKKCDYACDKYFIDEPSTWIRAIEWNKNEGCWGVREKQVLTGIEKEYEDDWCDDYCGFTQDEVSEIAILGNIYEYKLKQ